MSEQDASAKPEEQAQEQPSEEPQAAAIKSEGGDAAEGEKPSNESEAPPKETEEPAAEAAEPEEEEKEEEEPDDGVPIVLVTGASGFIANHLIKQLLEQGRYRVRGTVRNNKKQEKVW